VKRKQLPLIFDFVLVLEFKKILKNVMHKKIMYIFVIQFRLMKNSQLYKGSLNTIIMKLLEEQGRMYGYEITQKVKEITKGELNITEGALYPALHKLEADGLLDVEVEKVDNRLRKYYKLTEKGTTETVNRLAELEEFIKNMQTIVNPKLSY
jgi:PadR family transcriptional regulator, regulatory protein PadR